MPRLLRDGSARRERPIELGCSRCRTVTWRFDPDIPRRVVLYDVVTSSRGADSSMGHPSWSPGEGRSRCCRLQALHGAGGTG